MTGEGDVNSSRSYPFAERLVYLVKKWEGGCRSAARSAPRSVQLGEV